MEPTDCRTALARLVSEEATLLESLGQQLRLEHEFLTANDVAGLEQAGAGRQCTVERLLHLEDERRQLCRKRGHAGDAAGLAALLRWCDATGSLADAYARSAKLAQACREQNDRNGMLVNARLNRVSQVLTLLNAGTDAPRTYDGKLSGRHAPAAPPGRMVSISA
jgi:flagellar biosynthesis/type III secretory pathway chaperone